MTTKTTIAIGDVSARAAHFVALNGNPNHRYIVFADKPDFVAFLQTYNDGKWESKQATGVNLDSSDKRFFMVAVSDCYDPPIAIIRADNECEAEGWFADELTWAHISEPDLADYDDESMSYNSSGVPYETDNIVIWEVRMTHIELA